MNNTDVFVTIYINLVVLTYFIFDFERNYICSYWSFLCYRYK